MARKQSTLCSAVTLSVDSTFEVAFTTCDLLSKHESLYQRKRSKSAGLFAIGQHAVLCSTSSSLVKFRASTFVLFQFFPSSHGVSLFVAHFLDRFFAPVHQVLQLARVPLRNKRQEGGAASETTQKSFTMQARRG